MQPNENGVLVEVEVQTEETEDLWKLCSRLNMNCKPMGRVTLKNIMEALQQKVAIDENQTRWEDKELELVYVSNSF
jgi:quinolinate synthase